MLKTYANDFKYAKNFIESFNIYNDDAITLFVLVPESDTTLFSEFSSKTIVVISEKTIPVSYFEYPINGISPGYLNQQIVKLAFWKLGLCENYLCVDSDSLFIRNFGVNDFMTPGGQPYTVLIEDRELQCDPEYFTAQWQDRSHSLLKIQEFLGLGNCLILQTCHNSQIFSATILAKMQVEVLDRRGLTYIDLLTISAYEFSWYNYFLQGLNIKLYTREPFFKMYSSPRQLIKDRVVGMAVEDLARGYLGIIVNSNLGKNRETPLIYDAPLQHILGQYVSLPILLGSFIWGMKRLPAIVRQRIFRKNVSS